MVPLVHHAVGDGTTLVAVMFSLMDNANKGGGRLNRRPRRPSAFIPVVAGYPPLLRAPMLLLDVAHVAWIFIFGVIEAVRPRMSGRTNEHIRPNW